MFKINLHIFLLLFSIGLSQNYSLGFNGESEVQIDDLGTFNDFIINSTFLSNNTINETQTIFSINPGIDCEPLISLYLDENGYLKGQIRDNEDCGARVVSSDYIISNDNIYHDASLSYIDNKFELWIDGNLVDSIDDVDIEYISPNVIARIGSMPYPNTAGNPDFKGFYGRINKLEIIKNNQVKANYTFNTGSGNILYDNSGNDYHGAIYGANWIEETYGCIDEYADNYNFEAEWSDGSCTYPDNGDYSLSFDGDDSIQISSFDYSGSSLSFQIETSILLESNYPTLFYFGQEDGGDNLYTRSIDLSIDAINFNPPFLRTNLNYDYGLAGTSNFPLDEYIQISGVFDGQNQLLTLYVNGQQVDSNQVNANQIIFESSDDNYTIGSGYSLGDQINFFNGNIRSFSIWKGIINQDDLSDPSNIENDLIAKYNFNAGQDNILYDHSGNGYHGIINGAEWICEHYDACDVCNGDNLSCSTIIDIDGNIYPTIEIGEQNWMKENLRVTHYKDGTVIPTGLSSGPSGEWYMNDEGAYSVYDNNQQNVEIYGHLYNWYAATDSRGVCPEGWHVPSEQEFNELIEYLGGSDIAGGKLKEAGFEHWNYPNIGATNESGFTALPAGIRYGYADLYQYINLSAFFWSSDYHNIELEQSKYMRVNSDIMPNYADGDDAIQYYDDMHRGFSIRCLEDIYDCAGIINGASEIDICGVCNGNSSSYNYFDITNIVALVEYILEDTWSSDNLYCLDINQDAILDIADVVMIIQSILGE